MWLMASGLLCLAACGNKERSGDDDGQTKGDIMSTVKNLNELKNSANKIEEVQAKLSQAVPISNDALRQFFPETLNGWRRTEYAAGNPLYTVELTEGRAIYAEGEKEIGLQLTDGAGEMGSSIVSLAAAGLLSDFEKETAYDITKHEKVNGIVAATKETKNHENQPQEASITFVYHDRYLVKLEGTGVTLAELKKIVPALRLDQLQ